MKLKKRVLLSLTALLAPTLLFVGYVKAKPTVRRLKIQATVPLFLQLPSGQSFPGLVAVTEDYVGGCSPDQGCDTPRTQRILAVAADGRTSEQFWEFSAPGQKYHRQSIINGDGIRLYVSPLAKAKTTYRIPGNDQIERRTGRLNPAKDCTEDMGGNYPFSEFQKIMGMEDIVATDAKTTFHTVKYRLDTPTAEAFFWYAPALGCMELRSEYNWKPNKAGGRYLKTTHVTRSVQLAAPPEAMFTVSADHVEMKPSDIAHTLYLQKAKQAGRAEADAEKAWQAFPDVKRAALQRDDDMYITHRANTP